MSETRRQDNATPAGPVGRFFEDAVSKSRFWWLLLGSVAADRAVHRDPALRLHHRRGGGRIVRCVLPVAAVNEVMIGAVSSSTGWRIAHGC